MKATFTGHTSLRMLRTAALDSDNDIDNSTNINQFKAQSSGAISKASKSVRSVRTDRGDG